MIESVLDEEKYDALKILLRQYHVKDFVFSHFFYSLIPTP